MRGRTCLRLASATLFWFYSRRSRRTGALRADVPATHSQSKTRADAEAGKDRRYVPAGCAPSGTRSEPRGSFAGLGSHSRIILPVRVFEWTTRVPKWTDNYSAAGRTKLFELLALPIFGGEMFEKLEEGPFGD
jgi:hypothetical protein